MSSEIPSVKFPPEVEKFLGIFQAPFEDEPIPEMNAETTRDIHIIAQSIQAASARWRGNQDIRSIDALVDRKKFWGDMAAHSRSPLLPVLQEKYGHEGGDGRVAIDLGCGNSQAIPFLLKKGWWIIAVDSSRPALDLLEKCYPGAIASRQLKIVESDIATYVPEEPVDLVIASDVLPYTDPVKFLGTCQKIHDTFLNKGGFFAGTLFRSHSDPAMNGVMQTVREMGGWFLPDKYMVEPLLKHFGYEVKTCNLISNVSLPRGYTVQFLAQKRNPDPDSAGIPKVKIRSSADEELERLIREVIKSGIPQ